MGKKFDAHEKHFRGKEIGYQQKVKQLIKEYEDLKVNNNKLCADNENLRLENFEIKVRYLKLLEYSKLSDDEIKLAVESDKTKQRFVDMMSVVDKLDKYFI